MGNEEDLRNRSDVFILCELEKINQGDERAQRLLAEMRRRLYSLRMQEMMYHVDTYLDTASPCRKL